MSVDGIVTCNRHNTVRDAAEEPCWGCVRECEHEKLSGEFGDKTRACKACGLNFVTCRGCYVLGSGMPVYHAAPECSITDEEWAEVLRREREQP